jgi:hypothetical protein
MLMYEKAFLVFGYGEAASVGLMALLTRRILVKTRNERLPNMFTIFAGMLLLSAIAAETNSVLSESAPRTEAGDVSTADDSGESFSAPEDEEDDSDDDEKEDLEDLSVLKWDDYKNKMLSEMKVKSSSTPAEGNKKGASRPSKPNSSKSPIDRTANGTLVVPSGQLAVKDDGFNYASFDAGAKLLSSSEHIHDAHAILIKDSDRYMKAPCESRKWVVVQLSEDIMIRHIVLANLEHYSGGVQVRKHSIDSVRDLHVYAHVLIRFPTFVRNNCAHPSPLFHFHALACSCSLQIQ